jgi:hypothetical protein
MDSSKIEYNNWITNNQKPIIRSHQAVKISDRHYDFSIKGYGFDILHKFFILLKNPDDIKEIKEARLFISSEGIKLKPEQFKSVSKYCYELEFITENTTNSQLMIPLAMIPNTRYDIYVSLFLNNIKNIDDIQIISEYYQMKNGSRLNTLKKLKSKDIYTNLGTMRILNGFIGLSTVLCTYSHHDNHNYDIIHGQLFDMYKENKLKHNESFEFVINYQDYVNLDISKLEMTNIIEGLSFEWNVFCQKDDNSDIWTFYF